MVEGKIYFGAVIILYQKHGQEKLYIVVENKTGKITFPAGAQEGQDKSLFETAQREINEELGLTPEDYVLQPTDISYEFTFGEQKKERAGAKGIYTIFMGMIKPEISVKATSELKSIRLMTAVEAIKVLSFDDLREVVAKII